MLPYRLRTQGDVIVVDIVALSLAEGPELESMRARLGEELMRSTSKRMVVDCSRLKFMASCGLSLIVALARLAEQQKGSFIVCGLNEPLRQIFRLGGVDRYLRTCATREEAVAALTPGP